MAQIAISCCDLYRIDHYAHRLNAIGLAMAIQFRVSEMMNFLAFYNKKYLIAVTLGCMIANLFSFGWIDVFVGGGSTFVFVRTWTHSIWSIQKTSSCLTVLIRLDHFLFCDFLFHLHVYDCLGTAYYLQGQPFFYELVDYWDWVNSHP